MLEKICFAVAMTAAVLGLCVSNASATFSSSTNFGTGVFPSSVDLGDLNGDGYDDIVTSNYNSTRVVVLLNNGNRTFAPAVTYAGSGPYEAKLGLIDGDEHLDLVTTTEGLTAQFRPGLGDGTFGGQSLFEVGGGTSRGLAIGEFNGDSHPDLAVTKFDGANVSIVLGNGDGTFGGPVSYVTGSGSRSVSTGDLNGDTKQDLVVVNSNAGNLSVFLGNGDGSFSSLGNLTGAATPYYSALADVNGDGKTDLAFTNHGGDNVSVRFGVGDGTFLPATNYPVGHLPAGIASVDVDGDGDIDLATANYDSPGNVSVLSNNGDGTFAPATNYPAGDGPRGIAVGDLDEAPGPDIAAANFLGNQVSVFFNRVPSAQAAPSNPDFGSLDLDQPGEPLTVTLTNALGGDPMTVSGLAVTGADSSDFTLGDETCTAGPIAYSGTCTVELTFTPSAPGTRSATLAVEYNGFVSPLNVPLTGSGIAPAPPVTLIESGPTGSIDSDSATFTFSGTPAADIEKFQCRLDEAPWTDCSSPHTFEGLSNGVHTASFRSEDKFGQTDVDPPARTFSVAVPPDTVIDTGPGGNIVVDEATFTFHGVPGLVPVTGFECSLDGGTFSSCSSPHTVSGLGNGGHSVSVRAVDEDGLIDPTPASRLFTVNVPAPDTVIDSGPTGTITTSSATFTFHGTPEARIDKLLCKQDYGSWFECTSPHTFNGLADGLHTIKFRAVDTQGKQDPSPASQEFTVSTSPPPDRTARISKVTVKGPARTKLRKPSTYNVRITNSGEAAATGVKIKVRGKGVVLNRSVIPIPPATTEVFKLRIKPKKPGKVKLVFKVTSTNAGNKTVRKKVTVRR